MPRPKDYGSQEEQQKRAQEQAARKVSGVRKSDQARAARNKEAGLTAKGHKRQR